jgi:hypothetical protein
MQSASKKVTWLVHQHDLSSSPSTIELKIKISDDQPTSTTGEAG